MSAMKITPCECPEPGYCNRHRFVKARLLWLACQRDLSVFERWEQGFNPGTLSRVIPASTGLIPCEHRGKEIQKTVKCETCGQREIDLPVYPCSLHGECTERRFGNSTALSRSMPACTTCSDYQPIVEDV